MSALNEVRSVLVTNISPSANEKTVSDFFSFCGKINQLFLKKEEGKDTSSAVIQFETESAAKTALLLTNALIVDRPITVTAYVQSSTSTPSDSSSETPAPVSAETQGTPVEAANISQKDFGGVADEDRSKTSVIASLLAAGYTLAKDALAEAKAVDERNNFSARAQIVVDQMVVKAKQIDDQYKISEKANTAVTYVNDTAHNLNEKYGITEKASAAVATLGSAAQVGIELTKQGIDKAQENATVKKGVDTVKSSAAAVSDKINEISSQTRHEIDAKSLAAPSDEKPSGVDMQQ